MARYTRSLSLALPLGDCFTQLKVVLEDCNFQMLFSKEDCIIAQERPGQVPFAKLATIEVLVDSTRATSHVTTVDIVVKNEELPLQSNNHCFQIFNQLDQSLNQYSGWQVIGDATDPAEQEHPQPRIPSHAPDWSGSLPLSTPVSAESHVSQPALSTLPTDTDQLAPFATGMSKQSRAQTYPIAVPAPQPITHQGDSAQQETVTSPDSELRVQKRGQTTAHLEKVQHQRPDSVANLEKLRQKHSDSIANLEKIRQKRDHWLTKASDSDRMESPSDNLNQRSS